MRKRKRGREGEMERGREGERGRKGEREKEREGEGSERNREYFLSFSNISVIPKSIPNVKFF